MTTEKDHPNISDTMTVADLTRVSEATILPYDRRHRADLPAAKLAGAGRPAAAEK